MANQTVSTSKNFDDASILGLVSGDTLTVDSLATVTIDSDMRWGQQAAVPGVLTVTAATGGTVFHDATKVWEIPFTSSSGNVPTLGTVGTQDCTGGTSGATGEFLGVWTALGVAPSAAGGAMPASGFVKFRSKVGTFTAGETINLPGGATITATDAGRRSWLHAVYRNVNNCIIVRRLGDGFIIRSDWYELGTCDGNDSQQFQFPVADACAGLFIEKTPGSATTVKDYTTLDEYQHVPAAQFIAPLIATDDRGLAFTCTASGVITMPSSTVGKKPAAGCRVFIKNQIFSTAANTNYAANVIGATTVSRGTISATQAVVDIDGACFCGWYPTFSSYRQVTMTNYVAFDKGFIGASSLGDTTISHAIEGNWSQDLGSGGFSISSCINGNILFSDLSSTKLLGVAFRDSALTVDTCKNVTLRRCETRFSNKPTIVTNSENVIIDSCTFQGLLQVSSCKNVVIRNHSICGRAYGIQSYAVTAASWAANVVTYTIGAHDVQVGEAMRTQGLSPSGYNNAFTVTAVGGTTVSAALTTNPGAMTVAGSLTPTKGVAIQITYSADVIIDGVQQAYGLNYPYYSYVVTSDTISSNVRLRRIASRAAPMDCLGVTLSLASIVASTLSSRVSRCYGANMRGADSVYGSTSDALAITDCGTPTDPTKTRCLFSNNQVYQRFSAAGLKTAGTAAGQIQNTFAGVGAHFINAETATNEILAGFIGTEKTNSYPSSEAYEFTAGSPKFDGAQGLVLAAVGDQIVFTQRDVKGCTAGENTAPLFNGTNQGNHLFEYDLDKGTGFSGTWQTANATNWSAETGILPSRLDIKWRVTCTVASATNLVRYFGLFLVTSEADILANLYPLNEPICTLTGGISGSSLSVFDDTTGLWLTSNLTAASFAGVPWNADANVVARLSRPGYPLVETTQLLTEAGFDYAVAQTPWSVIPATDPGALNIEVLDYGASPITKGGKVFSASIRDVTDAYTDVQIANFINYNRSRDWPALGAYRGQAWHDMLVENGASFETQRGRIFGSAGATLKGVVVLNGDGSIRTTISRHQADDGSYYVAPTYAAADITNLLAGTQIRVYDMTTATETLNTLIAGTSWSDSYLDTTTYTAGDIIQVDIRKEGYTPVTYFTVATTSGWGVRASQVVNPYFSASSPADFTVDYVNKKIRATGVRDTFTAQDLIDIISAAEATATGITLPVFASTSGNVELSPGVSTALTVNLLGWQTSWSAGSVGQAFLQGGNIVGGIAGDPVEDVTGGPQVTIQLAQAGTVVVGTGISPTDAATIASAVLGAMNATPPATNVKLVNDVTVKGTGVVGDEWGPV